MNEDESEKTEEKVHIDKSSFASRIRTAAKNQPFEFILVCANLILVLANLMFICFNWQSNERAEKLFIGQNKPLIDVTPFKITQYEINKETKMCETLCSIVNYSGFVAYNIVVDVTYISNVWITEWLKADYDNKKMEKGVVIGKPFFTVPKATAPESFIRRLKLVTGASQNILVNSI